MPKLKRASELLQEQSVSEAENHLTSLKLSSSGNLSRGASDIENNGAVLPNLNESRIEGRYYFRQSKRC